jgi:hypothetical protein
MRIGPGMTTSKSWALTRWHHHGFQPAAAKRLVGLQVSLHDGVSDNTENARGPVYPQRDRGVRRAHTVDASTRGDATATRSG